LHTHEQAKVIYQTLKQEFGLSTAQFKQIGAIGIATPMNGWSKQSTVPVSV